MYNIKLENYFAKSSATNDIDELKLGSHTVSTLKRLSELYAVEINKENEDLFRLAAKALIFHDLGKASPDFQRLIIKKIIPDHYNTEKENIKAALTENIGINDHEIISAVWAASILDMMSKDNQMVATAILFHHYNDFYKNGNFMDYVAYNSEQFSKCVGLIRENFKHFQEFMTFIGKKEEWPEFISNVIKDLKEIDNPDFTGIKNAIDNKENIKKYFKLYNPNHIDSEGLSDEDYKFFSLLGLVRRCDYGASAQIDFNNEHGQDELFSDIETSINNKISYKNYWQKRILSDLKYEQNLFLTAPTGSGKTEFALLWAKRQNRKLIYTLPLRVALNSLYSRTKSYLKNYIKNDIKNVLSLVHSSSYLKYLDEVDEGNTLNQEIGTRINESRLFKNQINFSTVDQIMLSSLHYYGFDILYPIYSESAVVIDEIQSYTPEMMAIIFNTLDDLIKLKSRILVITATLPTYLKETLVDKGFGEIKLRDTASIKNYYTKRHKIQVNNTKLLDKSNNKTNDKRYTVNEVALSEILESANNNKKILVIVNTVARAIDAFKDISKKIKEETRVFLLHSRLVTKEKENIINELSTSLRENKSTILISTQIVEASINYDFDILYTELSPIDSQIQRWGRVYRNRDTDYKGENSNVIIFTEHDKNIETIYDKTVLSATKKILMEDDRLVNTLNFSEEEGLLNDVFNIKENGETLNDSYKKQIKKHSKYFKYFTASKRNDALKLFRHIASQTIVIADLIENKDLQDIVKGNGDWGWDKIVKEVSTDKFTIMKYLENASVSLPYGIKPSDSDIKEFKGFKIFTKKLEPEDIKNLNKYGADEITDLFKLDKGDDYII